MLRATDPESVVEHGTWARDIDPGRPWGSGAVTLVGDAAHPIRPVTGAAPLWASACVKPTVFLAPAQRRRRACLPCAAKLQAGRAWTLLVGLSCLLANSVMMCSP